MCIKHNSAGKVHGKAQNLGQPLQLTSSRSTGKQVLAGITTDEAKEQTTRQTTTENANTYQLLIRPVCLSGPHALQKVPPANSWLHPVTATKLRHITMDYKQVEIGQEWCAETSITSRAIYLEKLDVILNSANALRICSTFVNLGYLPQRIFQVQRGERRDP